jgi:diacylglycerol kinase (ATP)
MSNNRTAAVIYNPIKVEVDDLRAAIAAEPGAEGWTLLWLETTEDDPGTGQAREALEKGASVVIAVGGDGTVRTVSEVVRTSKDASVALLPSGTGNLLARNLDLTLDDMAHSIRTAFTGTPREVDVASIDIRRADGSHDEHAFLVMAGAGLDAKIMSNTDPELKKKVGWLAYAQALGVVLRDKGALRVGHQLDGGRRHTDRAQAIIVGNCGSLPANILLLPDAAVDDGLLDVVVLKPESIRGWLAVVFKVFWENGIVKRTPLGKRLSGVDIASMDYTQGKKLDVRLSKPEEIELDGDPFGETTAFTVTVEPGALRVLVPAEES